MNKLKKIGRAVLPYIIGMFIGLLILPPTPPPDILEATLYLAIASMVATAIGLILTYITGRQD